MPVPVPVLEDQGGYEGLLYNLGQGQIFVVEVERDADYNGRTRLTGHDDDGEEVEIWFYPDTPTCAHCGDEADDTYYGEDVCSGCLTDLEENDEGNE